MFKKIIVAMAFLAIAQAAEIVTVKKVIRYKKEASIDFSGSVIKSKVRTPEVFYVFRRKRTAGGELNVLPQNFKQHSQITFSIVKDFAQK